MRLDDYVASVKRRVGAGSHETTALRIAAAQRGRRVYYGTLIDLITSLA